MIPLPTIDCNRCGECCRQGGGCMFRGRSWSLRQMPLEFVGACELLTQQGECSVMKNVIAQDGSDAALRKYGGVVGVCNFPALKREAVP